ncbi:MAG TPA: arsenate reductase ArsC [Candidatus Eremiobacteraceae bacterium]|nr:arsenate reductase ArsC [Candidatus Eremiobacteraceae bacterium]
MATDRTKTLVDQALSGASNLYAEFKGLYSMETIRRFLEENADTLVNCKVTVYLPIFACRFTRERLTAMAQVAGSIPKTMPEVLFVCTHNAGRSQIAAAILDAKAKGKVHVRSAGSTPGDAINPVVIEAMSEIGLDLSKEFPKPMTDDVVQAADAVITMGCGDACPIYPGKKYEDWDVEDPAGKDLMTVRRIRDDIVGRVDRLILELAPADQTS